MNCEQVIPLLSPFHDGELSPGEHRLVVEHLSECSECSRRIESLGKLSGLVEAAHQPKAPASLLPQVEAMLQTEQCVAKEPIASGSRKLLVGVIAAVAAVVLVGITIWSIVERPHRHSDMIVAFDQFLKSYEQTPAKAVEVLPHRYSSVRVDKAGASAALKRPTVTPDRLLGDHVVVERCLLRMPCCDCVQTTYAQGGVVSLVVLEHEKEQAEWFHERPSVRTQCQGKACCLVELRNGLAASWPIHHGYVTVVGIRDVSELERLVGELEAEG